MFHLSLQVLDWSSFLRSPTNRHAVDSWGDLSKAGNCTGLEKVPAWNKLVAGNSPCLELARSKMVSPRAWKMLSPGLHSRLEKLAGWKKALAGNDSWLEQGLCESQKELSEKEFQPRANSI